MGESIIRLVRWMVAHFLALIGIVLPYRARIRFIQALSFSIHFPYRAFGHVARWMLRVLEIQPEAETATAPNGGLPPMPPLTKKGAKAAVLFSGGTDSTCTAYLLAQSVSELHLLTYFERATKNSPVPTANIESLRRTFPGVNILSATMDVDALVRRISYSRYLRNILLYRSLVMATCGYSTLSWHVRTAVYCLDRGIGVVADGLTRELMHFPGHMDEVIQLIREFYAKFGIEYKNPVRAWDVPLDQQFIDRMIVNIHAGEFALGDTGKTVRKTTGQYLYQQGFFPSPNIKGSRQDFAMQHDCYPFALYNIIAFWGFLGFGSYHNFCSQVAALMRDKLAEAAEWVEQYRQHGPASELYKYLAVNE